MANSEPTMKPTGPAGIGRSVVPLPTNEHLLERILSRENMVAAWRRVKTNRGAPGIDGMTIEAFPAWLRQHWKDTRQALMEGRYRPAAVRKQTIPKPTGGERILGIPTVLDRLIQQAIAQILTPIFDPTFSDRSYGFRPGRSAHQAVFRLRDAIKAGYTEAVDCDLSKFFDRVDHDLLMARVARKVRDKRVLRLIGRYLRAGLVADGKVEVSNEGVPQGGPLSPLLANILLDDFDKELERRGHQFVRYADDFIIVVKSRRAAARVRANVTRFLTSKLKLVVNETKSRTCRAFDCTFLGFTFPDGAIRWTDSAFADFRHRLKRLTGRSWGVSMEHRMTKLAQYINGWMGYYRISEYYKPLHGLDEWLRRRVRMCYWKQWRNPRTRIGNLIKLNMPARAAIAVGLSRKSYWHLSRTPATNAGLGNKFLADQGLLNIKAIWCSYHYPDNPRWK